MKRTAAYANQNQLSQLVEQHTPLVKRIAYHILARLPASVIVEDLIQAGMIGLIEAAKNFDGSKGASFETYAGIRIRGAIIDETRKGDWVPRSVHKNAREVAAVINQLESSLGREPKDIEVAEKLDITLDEYHHILRDISNGKIIGIEDLGVDEDVIDAGLGNKEQNPLVDIQQDKFNKALVEAIQTLPEREALVLSLYYNDEMNLKEIGLILEVSESRVSQIHSQAMVRLKAKVHDWI
ncbi:RNA polymerase sigma factor FliA [Pseudoalteromonas spongiae]|uniref:RNA polymerase sigma factor FliA n=1 Tax=Pseudoalteromonas spongiae TaxID=298657 RepID=UPI000C2D0191|nr:RNA polymerase sigma factor FliA [Pseudoalteromonas spongiae]